MREVACAGAARTLLGAECGASNQRTITIAAGVHGDEPAGAFALLELAAAGELDADYAYRLWPCVNPSGFAGGTRENAEGIDVNRSFGKGGQTPEARAILTANRDRNFMLSIDLHEDDDADGFYVYQYGAHALAREAVEAVRAAGFPVQDLAQFDLGVTMSAQRMADGVVSPDRDEEAQAIGGFSYTLALMRRAAQRALTFETPSRLPLTQRTAIHRIAVKAAIAALSKQHPHDAA